MKPGKLHKGTFTFMANAGCSIHDMRNIIALYAPNIGMKRPNRNRSVWYVLISNEIQKDFNGFKTFFRKNGFYKKHKHNFDYDNWWQECNLDGTFAYNGVTDDF